jgi:hypothetical protein
MMKEYFPLLAIAAIIIFNILKKRRAAEDESTATAVPRAVPTRVTARPARPVRPAMQHEADSAPTPPTAATTPTKEDDTRTEINLSTTEEARRAFISSEIFNRKY